MSEVRCDNNSCIFTKSYYVQIFQLLVTFYFVPALRYEAGGMLRSIRYSKPQRLSYVYNFLEFTLCHILTVKRVCLSYSITKTYLLPKSSFDKSWLAEDQSPHLLADTLLSMPNILHDSVSQSINTLTSDKAYCVYERKIFGKAFYFTAYRKVLFPTACRRELQ